MSGSPLCTFPFCSNDCIDRVEDLMLKSGGISFLSNNPQHINSLVEHNFLEGRSVGEVVCHAHLYHEEWCCLETNGEIALVPKFSLLFGS